MKIAPPRIRIALLAAALVAVGGVTAAMALGDDPPATATFRTVDGPNLFQLTAGSGSSTSASIVTGGTVSFTNMSTEDHDVHFVAPPQGGVSCTQTTGGTSPNALRFPNAPTSGTWGGTCTFTRAGTYSFMCDMHAGMTGTVVVSDPGASVATTTSTPVATTPVPVETVPTTSTPTSPAPASPANQSPTAPTTPAAQGPDNAQTPLTVSRALSIRVSVAQRGSSVRGAISGARGVARVRIALQARRGALGLTARAASLIAVGSLSALTTRSGALTFVVRLSGPARTALAKHGRLPVTVLVTAPPATGTAHPKTFKIVVRSS